MSKVSVSRSLLGFGIASLGGTLLHFLYDISGKSIFTAPFSGVNESTWEHMKLLFFPMLVYSLIDRLFHRDEDNFWCIKLRSILLGLALIPVLFYTYNGVIGKSPDFVNITIFFVSAAAAYYYEYRIMKSDKVKCRYDRIALVVIIAIGAAFVIFTFKTPSLEIFRDPLTGEFGLNG